MHFEHHEFVLDLDSSWTQLASNDPEQFPFESKPLASNLTISVMSARIPPAKMKEAAERVLALRLEAEMTVDPSRNVTIGDQWIAAKPNGEVIEVAYAGFDNYGNIFRFMGFVTSQKVVSFYCETISTDNERSKRIFDEAFRGFRFYIP